MGSLYDERHEFLFEKRHGEEIGIVEASTTSERTSGNTKVSKVSNKVGMEIVIKNY